ncbi:hypothetical protein [Adlercreutzia sp. ZJ138]|uniref:hypothetical protein n=1 Tax=Adlercreutzia sp. ZJ138 TaxID=2709405 RepID=UPI0013ED9E6C|nr:hypothetical protein [Adlercreutzia sp. ZJ138]
MTSHIELLYIASLGQSHNLNDLGKKKFQKLVYLVETLGRVNLGYQYQIHLYGPFSKGLDDDLRELSSKNQVVYVRQNRSYLLHLTSEGEEVLHTADNMKCTSFDAIKRIFDQFSSRSPRDLELLTTSCFALNKLGDEADRESLKNCVTRIKGSKFTAEDIEQSVNEALELISSSACARLTK